MARAARSEELGGFRLWFGALGAIGAWTIHFATAYLLVPLICATGLVIILYMVSIAMALVALAALVVSWLNWRALDEEERKEALQPRSRPGFLVLLGLVAGVLFLLATVMGTVPIVVLDPCA